MVSLPESLDSSCLTSTRNSTTLPNKIGEIFVNNVPFAKDPAGNLFFFHNGCYHREGEFYVERLYKKWLEQTGSQDDWRDNIGPRVAKWILCDKRTRLLWDRPPLHTICLLNGLYDWNERILTPHTSDYLSTVQIPVTYDPDAECPTWDRFLKEILPAKGGDDYLRQIMAICLVPFMGIQKCIVLVGEGSNGKSTFLNGLQELIGLDNVSNIPFHMLTNVLERFARAGIVGKLVNIFGDMSRRKIEDAANFKALVGEDRMPIEYKHKDMFYYTPFCKLIFSCNEVVQSDDASVGYRRRFINVPLTQRFKVDPRIGTELNTKLRSPQELSGLLNKLLPLIGPIVDEGLSMSDEVVSIIDEWCILSDSMRAWLNNIFVRCVGGMVPMEAFYNFYAENAPGDETLREHAKVIKYIKHMWQDVQAGVCFKAFGKTVKCYSGIQFKDQSLAKMIWENAVPLDLRTEQ